MCEVIAISHAYLKIARNFHAYLIVDGPRAFSRDRCICDTLENGYKQGWKVAILQPIELISFNVTRLARDSHMTKSDRKLKAPAMNFLVPRSGRGSPGVAGAGGRQGGVVTPFSY